MPEGYQGKMGERQRASSDEDILERLKEGFDFCRSIRLKSLAQAGRFSHYQNSIYRLIRVAGCTNKSIREGLCMYFIDR